MVEPVHTAAEKHEPRVGHAAAHGALVGFLGLASVFSVLGLALGMEPSGAVAFGTYAGIFGGVGYGGMLGATFALSPLRDTAKKGRRST